MTNTEALVNVIADRTRRRVLELLAAADEGMTVDGIAAAAGVHRTVAASHLRLLAAAGLAAPTEERNRRGRPRLRYRAAAAAEVAWPARRHRELAEVLATALAGLGAEGERAAATAGRAFGARLGALDNLGASYTREGDALIARPCPFLEACRAAGPVVCRVHAAILEGFLGAECAPIGPRPASSCAYRVTPSS